MMAWSTFLGYQLVWFLTVADAAHGTLWPSLACSCVFIAWQLWASEHPTVDLRLLAVAVILGLIVDGVLAARGWARYATAEPAWPPSGAPIWILALWACFAMTLNRSLVYLQGRPLIALVLGALGGPLAYLSAARGWRALTLVPPTWRALVWLAASWAIAMLLFSTLARRWTGTRRHAAGALQTKTP
jgi:hypothetical protein